MTEYLSDPAMHNIAIQLARVLVGLIVGSLAKSIYTAVIKSIKGVWGGFRWVGRKVVGVFRRKHKEPESRREQQKREKDKYKSQWLSNVQAKEKHKRELIEPTSQAGKIISIQQEMNKQFRTALDNSTVSQILGPPSFEPTKYFTF